VTQIVRAQPEAAAALTAIAYSAKRQWGYPERWIALWADALTIRSEFIASHETYAALVDGQSTGFYALLCEGPDRFKLEHLWVRPEAMRRGIGRELFLHAIERAKALGGVALATDSDPNAAGFYERMGARHAGTRVTDLDGRRREIPSFVLDL